MLRFLTLVALAALPACAESQPKPAPATIRWADSVRREIEAATFAGDVDRLRAARALDERALVLFPGDALLLHYQGYALYREATMTMGQRGASAAAPLFRQAATALEKSAERRRMAETSALLAVVYGNLIAADQSQAMQLGMQGQALMGEATGIGSANPRVWLLKGMNALFTPEAYGGGIPTAVKHLTMAIGLFDRDDPAAGAPAWGKAEAHVWLGQAYEKRNEPAKAAAEYRAALAIEPTYAWVKSVLLPNVAR